MEGLERGMEGISSLIKISKTDKTLNLLLRTNYT